MTTIPDISHRRGRPANHHRNDALVQMVANGATLKDAAEHFGISVQRAGKIYQDARRRSLDTAENHG